MIYCNQCKWWSEDIGGFGECHRYAPRSVSVPTTALLEDIEADESGIHYRKPVWPVTGKDDFCGDSSENPSLRDVI